MQFNYKIKGKNRPNAMTLLNDVRLIIFDFDGVLVDTQQAVNELEWKYLKQQGVNLSLKNFTERFSGETAQSIVKRLRKEDNLAFPKANHLIAKEIDETVLSELSKTKITPMKGIENVLRTLPLKKCVASNCSLRILKVLLIASGLMPYFRDDVFSADMVKNPKPYPDLFLYAARKLGEDPSKSLVIEDTEVGVKAAVNAGMRVFGFLGGSHIIHSDEGKLIKAGAEQVLTDMKQLNNLLIDPQEKTKITKTDFLHSKEDDLSLQNYISERANMVKSQLEARGISDENVLKAMALVPRHLFIPKQSQGLSYEDSALPIGYDQTISQPYIVALMCEAANISPKDRVLDIGTGSGYQAAILSLLSKEVYSIELVKPLGEQAKTLLYDLGYKNVHVKIGDGYAGWPERAPYDAILVAAATEEAPQTLLNQLKFNGRLIIPLGSSFGQHLMRFTKTKEGLKQEDLGSVVFVPFKKESQ